MTEDTAMPNVRDAAATVGTNLAADVLDGITLMNEVDRFIRTEAIKFANIPGQHLQTTYEIFCREAWTAFCEAFDEGYTGR